MSIRFFDMFAGIGGFRSGLEAAGSFECAGHCEIDKYANKAYNAIYDIKETEVYFEDARKIKPIWFSSPSRGSLISISYLRRLLQDLKEILVPSTGVSYLNSNLCSLQRMEN